MANKKLALNIGIGASVNSSVGKSVDQVQKDGAAIAKSYDQINKKLGRARDVQKYERQLKKLNDRMVSGKGDMAAMLKVEAKLEKQLNQSRRAAKNAGVDIRNLAREEQQLAWKAKQAEKQQEALNRSIAKTGRMDKLRGMTGSAMSYGQGTMAGRGVSALGGSAGLAGGMGLAATGIGALAAGGAAAGAAGFAASVRMAEQLDAIGKKAEQLGVTTTALQELQYAAQSSGVEIDQMNDALQTQAEKISEAALGEGEAVEVLQALGLSARELNNLNPDQQIMKIADALDQVANQNDKQQLAIKLWGDAGAAMVNTINGGSKALAELRKNANPIDEQTIQNAALFNNALLNMQMSFGKVQAAVLGPALPWLTKQMESLSGWMNENNDTLSAFAEGAGKLFGVLFRIGKLLYQVVAPGFKLVWSAVSPLIDLLSSLLDKLLTISEAAVEFRDSFIASIADKFGDWFGNDESGTGEGGNAPPSMKPAGGNTVSNTSTYNMPIYQQQGESGDQVAMRIRQQLEERDRQNARRQRGMMYDMAPASM